MSMEFEIRDQICTADALIVIDMQNAFLSGTEAVPASERLISMVDVLLAEARAADAPVIFLQNDGPAGAVDEPFQSGWELFFSTRAHEVIVRKMKDDGFDGTDLHELLAANGVKTIAICGLLSEMCVAATARAAMERGYGVLLAHDSHATYDVPAGPGSAGVPAAMAARAAEWSLGDEIMICASAREVRFATTQQGVPTGR